jgi:hypothetical protein
MPITSVLWQSDRTNRHDCARDRHVLRSEVSQPLNLPGSVIVTPEVGAAQFIEDYFGAGANDVAVEFEPLFRCVRGATSYSGFGIHVDFATGAVTCDVALPPAAAPHNFIIQLKVTRNTGGRLAPQDIPPLLVRIHLHDMVTRLKLRPAEMTIHRRAPGSREETAFGFTAYAEFDDGTTGDVTEHHRLVWTAAQASNEVAPNGLVVLVAANTPGQTFDIVATTPVGWGSTAATGTVRVAPPWSAVVPPPTAVLIDGPPASWTSGHRADRRANVLFLAAGFPAEDDDSVTQLVSRVSHWMKRERLTRPYDLLAGSMNFWRLHVPAATRGLSIRCEMALRRWRGKLAVAPIGPTTRPPQSGPDAWSVANLYFAVGLPVPADLNRDPAVLRGEFASRALPEFALALLDSQIVPDSAITGWRERAQRTFVEDVDAFPPLAVGMPPSVMDDANTPLLDLHAERGGDAGFEDFLRSVVAGDGAVAGAAAERLGTVWAEARAEFAVDNRSLLTLIGALSFGRANHTKIRQHLVLEPGSRPVRVQSFVGSHTVTLDVSRDDLGFNLEREFWRVFAHELSHAVVHDEYVNAPATFAVEDDPAGTVFDDDPNVQSLATVLVPGSDPKLPKPKVSGDLVKWRWPRMRKAAVIDGVLAESSGEFRVPVVRGQAGQFQVRDKVRFRSRSPGVPLKRLDRAVDVSAEFEVVRVTPGAITDDVVIRLVSGAETLGALGRFGPGALLFAPVEPPAGSPALDYPYGELMTLAVRRWINDNASPLTDWPCNPVLEFARKGDVQRPRFDGFPSLFSHRHDPRTVGLYSGGAGFACGVFHPTGWCMMRNHASRWRLNELCAVCRYAIVDMFDPTLHGALDADLSSRAFE